MKLSYDYHLGSKITYGIKEHVQITKNNELRILIYYSVLYNYDFFGCDRHLGRRPSSLGPLFVWGAWTVKPGTSLAYTAPYSGPPAATLETSPVAVGQMIIFGVTVGYLYIVDISNGRIMDKLNLVAPVLSIVCLAGNLLYVANFSGNISCFQVNIEENP